MVAFAWMGSEAVHLCSVYKLRRQLLATLHPHCRCNLRVDVEGVMAPYPAVEEQQPSTSYVGWPIPLFIDSGHDSACCNGFKSDGLEASDHLPKMREDGELGKR